MTISPLNARLLHGLAHRFDGRLIGLVVVPVAHPVRRCDRGGLGDANELETRRPIRWNAVERECPL